MTNDGQNETYKIAWLSGDGVGKDVLDAVRIVLDKIQLNAEYIKGEIGWRYWMEEGDPFPKRTIEMLKTVDSAMFGAITSKPAKQAEQELSPTLKDKGCVYRSPIVRMRQEFDLYTCLRPTKSYPGNPKNYKDDIDIIMFRENTEDLYSGVEFEAVPNELADVLSKYSKNFKKFSELSGEDYSISCKINTKKGCEKIIRAAFEYAKERGRKKVTVIHKANVVRASDGLFLETGREIAKEYPGIEHDEANVDAITMWLLKNPERYDVIVAPNLYGDIVSDLCAQMTGGLGYACSGNIGDDLGVFEPTHGSAPKYAGKYVVNPIASILAAKMMLDWLGEREKAERLDAAVAKVISDGKIRTYDMGGESSTLEMAEAIAAEL